MYSITVCEDCDMEYPGDCPVHGPLIIVEDTKVKEDIYNWERMGK